MLHLFTFWGCTSVCLPSLDIGQGSFHVLFVSNVDLVVTHGYEWISAMKQIPVKIQRRRLFQWKTSQLNWNSWKTTTLYDTTTPNQRQNSQPLPNLQDPRQVGSSWQCFRPFLLPRQHNPLAIWFTIEFLRGFLYHVWTNKPQILTNISPSQRLWKLQLLERWDGAKIQWACEVVFHETMGRKEMGFKPLHSETLLGSKETCHCHSDLQPKQKIVCQRECILRLSQLIAAHLTFLWRSVKGP